MTWSWIQCLFVLYLLISSIKKPGLHLKCMFLNSENYQYRSILVFIDRPFFLCRPVLLVLIIFSDLHNAAPWAVEWFEPQEGSEGCWSVLWALFGLFVWWTVSDEESSRADRTAALIRAYPTCQIVFFCANKWTPFGVPPPREADEKSGLSDHPPILSPGLMYTAQVAFIGFTKGLMTGIMRVMWH